MVAAVAVSSAASAKTAGAALLFGWIAGIVTIVAITVLLSGLIPAGDEGQSRPVIVAMKLTLGIALVALVVRQFATRPRHDIEPVAPKWMAGIATLSVAQAALLGLTLMVTNRKNVLVAVGAGVAISGPGLALSSTVVLIGFVVVLGSAGIAVPLISHTLSPRQMATPLENLRAWFFKFNFAVSTVLALILGTQLIGVAIASL